jgi:hypothetical protein
MATPMTVKMPEPMTAPIPRAVIDIGPRDLRSARSGRSESAISLSIDLVAKSWDLVVKICLGRGELLNKAQPEDQVHLQIQQLSRFCVGRAGRA